MRNLLTIILTILLVSVALSSAAVAGYQVVMLGGYIPKQVGSDTGVADLDGDGDMEFLVKSTGPVTEFKIYDLVTGTQEFIYQHTASVIDMIHVVPGDDSGTMVGLIQCIDGDTYLVYHDGLAETLSSTRGAGGF